ncbi:MAG: hypothetical protein ACJ76F_13955 [Bacteroidia bacterium]
MNILKSRTVNIILILTGYYPLFLVLVMNLMISGGHGLSRWMVMLAWILNIPTVGTWFVLLLSDTRKLNWPIRINLVIQFAGIIYALLLVKMERLMPYMD